MSTFDKDTTENTAMPRGSGGDLQSKSLPDTAQPRGSGGDLQSKSLPDTAQPRGSGGDLQSKSLPAAGAAGAPQQPEDKREPEASYQTPTDSE